MIEKETIVGENDINKRLDSFIAESSLYISRSMVQKLINNKNIFVNEKIEKESYKIKKDDIIKVRIPDPKDAHLKAQNIPLDIVYEDNDIIVVNKPKGMVVHPRKWKS